MHTLSKVTRALGEGERARAVQFRFARDRHRYLLAHGVLRAIIASYTTTPAADLAFRLGRHGKPELASGGLRFTMTYSDDLIVFGICSRGSVGVDVERVRSNVERDVATCLPPAARRVLEGLPGPERRQAFFQAWTRMEAHAKAGGEGLDHGLNAFERFLGPSNPRCLPSALNDAQSNTLWLYDLAPREGYVGALAASRGNCAIVYRDWTAECGA